MPAFLLADSHGLLVVRRQSSLTINPEDNTGRAWDLQQPEDEDDSDEHAYASCEALMASGGVEYCEPNFKITAHALPNDPEAATQWPDASPASSVGLTQAWDLNTGSTGVAVAVIDTGIDYTHPDLAQNVWTNPGEIPDNGIDDDRNGVVDDVHGYNAIVGSGDPMDDNNHGTHVAGIIGAKGNNSIGGLGVNWNSSIIAVKFLDAHGMGTTFDAIKSIDYVVRLKQSGVPIRVINASWGGSPYAKALEDAIRRAGDAGILFVASAGNTFANIDMMPSYPASYKLPNVVPVAANDDLGNLAPFSNYGVDSVPVSAPGVAILSTIRGGGYARFSGTSMASPVVSGVAALLSAELPQLGVTELKARISNTVIRIGQLAGLVTSGGVVNAYNAIIGRVGETWAQPDVSVEEPILVRLSAASLKSEKTFRIVFRGSEDELFIPYLRIGADECALPPVFILSGSAVVSGRVPRISRKIKGRLSLYSYQGVERASKNINFMPNNAHARASAAKSLSPNFIKSYFCRKLARGMSQID